MPTDTFPPTRPCCSTKATLPNLFKESHFLVTNQTHKPVGVILIQITTLSLMIFRAGYLGNTEDNMVISVALIVF